VVLVWLYTKVAPKTRMFTNTASCNTLTLVLRDTGVVKFSDCWGVIDNCSIALEGDEEWTSSSQNHITLENFTQIVVALLHIFQIVTHVLHYPTTTHLTIQYIVSASCNDLGHAS
jgi:hypothetical protein